MTLLDPSLHDLLATHEWFLTLQFDSAGVSHDPTHRYMTQRDVV